MTTLKNPLSFTLPFLHPQGWSAFVIDRGNFFMEEIWKDIPGYEGLYQASTLGEIKSLARVEMRKDGTRNPIKERVLKKSIGTTGYYFLNLCKDGIRTLWKVHILIGITWIPNPENKPEINHVKGLKLDNRVTELEWNTRLENVQHANRAGLSKYLRGVEHPRAKLTQIQVDEIRAKYIPWKYTMSMLAQEYGLDSSIICGIIKNTRYAQC